MTTFSPPNDVTLAMPEDEESLLDLLRQRHEEDGVGNFDEKTVRPRVQMGIFRNGGNIGVIRRHGVIEASVGLFFSQFWYGSNTHLADYWNYVRPEHRRSTHAKHLIMFAKSYADALGVPLVMARLKNPTNEPVLKLYERQMPVSGAVFIYQPLQQIA